MLIPPIVRINSALRLFVILCFCFAQAGYTQHFPSRQYMTSDGMPTNSVFDIAQTASGVMWFISRSGPMYYDATEWRSFPDSLNLPSSIQSKIIAVGDVIWTAGLNKTDFTLQYYKNGTWTEVVNPIKGKTPMEIFGFYVTEKGSSYRIFLAYKNVLYEVDLEEGTETRHSLNNETILNIKAFQGEIIFCTRNGLWKFNEGQPERFDLPYEKLPNTTFLDVQFRNETLHLLGQNWYAEYKNQELTFLSENLGMNEVALYYQSSLVIDKAGSVIFGAFTAPKVLNKRTNTWQTLLIDGKEVNIGSTRVYCDQENNIWVSDSRGLFKFNVLQFINYNRSSGLLSDEVSAVTQGASGEIYLANPLSLNILRDGTIDSYHIRDGKLPTERILDLEVDEKNQRLVIAANDAGLLQFDTRRPDAGLLALNDNWSFTALEHYQGNIYAASDKGIYMLRGNQLTKALDLSSIRNICAVNGYLYFLSNSSGVIRYDGEKIQRFGSSNFDLSSAYSVVDYEGELILATANGLATLQGSTIVPWNKLNINTPVYSLLVDSKNRLWLGTDHGIYHYKEESLNLFDQRKGLVGNEINRNALIEDQQSRIWIGTEKGVSVFEDELNRQQDYNLKVHLTSVHAADKRPLSTFTDNAVPFEFNDLFISYRCHSYVDESQTNFRYRLQDSEESWISRSDALNEIVLSNLSPGNYTFEIQARSGTGDWGESTLLSFRIKPPFYRTGWFIISAAFIIILIARLVFHYRYLLLIRQQKKLKEQVAERTREIAQLNEQLEAKVKERTAELEKKNVLLEEYAFINAHHLRGPLTKIMSALYVIESGEEENLDVEMIKILKDAVEELDAVIYSINGILKTED